MPKVSVIIPAYNAMTYLPETLDSVLKQTFTEFEVLIINDGSTDCIEQWVTQLTDLRIKLISKHNQGLSAARNTGIEHAQGKYIAFLDADDLWEPTKLEKQVRCLEECPEIGLVYTWTRFINEASEPTERVVAFQVEGNVWEYLLVRDIICNGSSAMVRGSCFETVGLFDVSLNSVADRDMWVRIAARYPFAVVKEPLTLYRRHRKSMSQDHKRMLQEVHQVTEKIFQDVPFELLYLRNQTYGWINLFTAFSFLEHDMNYKEAMYHYHQAALHYPQIRFTPIFLRLRLAVAIIHWLGPDSYTNLRELTRIMSRQLRLAKGI